MLLLMDSGIKETFKNFENTDWFERYTHNVYSFAAEKDLTETEILREYAKESKSYQEFKSKAKELTSLNRTTWLETEIETISTSLEMGEVWKQMESNRIKEPNWKYQTMRDNRVRPEHAALEGKIFRIGDPQGDSVFPPNGYLCRCRSTTLSDSYITSNNLVVSKGSDYLDALDSKGKNIIDPDFRYNPSKQLLPMKERDLNYKTYGL